MICFDSAIFAVLGTWSTSRSVLTSLCIIYWIFRTLWTNHLRNLFICLFTYLLRKYRTLLTRIKIGEDNTSNAISPISTDKSIQWSIVDHFLNLFHLLETGRKNFALFFLSFSICFNNSFFCLILLRCCLSLNLWIGVIPIVFSLCSIYFIKWKMREYISLYTKEKIW